MTEILPSPIVVFQTYCPGEITTWKDSIQYYQVSDGNDFLFRFQIHFKIKAVTKKKFRTRISFESKSVWLTWNCSVAIKDLAVNMEFIKKDLEADRHGILQDFIPAYNAMCERISKIGNALWDAPLNKAQAAIENAVVKLLLEMSAESEAMFEEIQARNENSADLVKTIKAGNDSVNEIEAQIYLSQYGL
jgi:hypothetical protein